MYKTRVMIFLAIIGLVLIALIARLGHLQLVRGDHYLLQAQQSLQRTEVLPAQRGKILDRHGRILAMDKACFEFCLDYRFITDNPTWVRRQVRLIARSQNIETEQARKVYDVLRTNTWNLARALSRRRGLDIGQTVKDITDRVRAYHEAVGTTVREELEFHPVVPGLDEPDAVEASHRLDQTIGATLRPSHMRWYPQQFTTPEGDLVSTASHIIGRIGTVNPSEQQRLNLTTDEADRLTRERMNYRGWDQIGKSGVEKLAETVLRGKRGYRRLKLGEQIIEDTEAEPGQDVQLTIDIRLQQVLTQRLMQSHRSGAIVVLDIPTREVLALVSTPLYNLNTFNRDFPQLVKDVVDLPLLNRAITQRYPPGSTVNPIVALAAMADDLVTQYTTFNCRGYLHRPGSFRCTGRHGDIQVVEAIQRSCNIYFYEV
ncbi:MAG: penicillin-binding transpeptidase domain-containing protein, partial [Planctomycetota bacterium]